LCGTRTVLTLPVHAPTDPKLLANADAAYVHCFRADIKSRPLMLVNLAPSLDIVKRRNEERTNKTVFEPWSPILDRAMRETMNGIGLWLDNSNQTSELGKYLQRSNMT
jgi:hypothetical protein